MKPRYLPFTLLFFLLPSLAIPDAIDKVADLFRHGNVPELSKFFAPNIEITMQDEENVYSKIQAGLILDRFFAQNKPLSVKMLHKVNSSASYRFGVLILNTQKGPFRVAYTLKDADGHPEIIEIRIETEKVK